MSDLNKLTKHYEEQTEQRKQFLTEWNATHSPLKTFEIEEATCGVFVLDGVWCWGQKYANGYHPERLSEVPIEVLETYYREKAAPLLADDAMRRCGLPTLAEFQQARFGEVLKEYYTGTDIPDGTVFEYDATKDMKKEGPYTWPAHAEEFMESCGEDGGKMRGKLLPNGKIMLLVKMSQQGTTIPIHCTILK